jgi:hypothetical protein
MATVGERQAERVDQKMPPAAVDLLAGIEAAGRRPRRSSPTA